MQLDTKHTLFLLTSQEVAAAPHSCRPQRGFSSLIVFSFSKSYEIASSQVKAFQKEPDREAGGHS